MLNNGSMLNSILGSASRGGKSGYTYLLTLVSSGTKKVGLQVYDANGNTVSDMTFSPTTLVGTLSVPAK